MERRYHNNLKTKHKHKRRVKKLSCPEVEKQVLDYVWQKLSSKINEVKMRSILFINIAGNLLGFLERK